MSTAILAPSLRFKSWRNDGTPNAEGTLYTYQAGTTTPVSTYTDSTAGTTDANPIQLNSRGECNLWLLPNVAYKFVEFDSNGTQINVTDQVTAQQLLTLYGGTDTGVVNAYVLSYNAPYSAYQDGIGIYWTPAHTNTGASTVNVSFNSGSSFAGVVAIVNQDGTALGSGELIANQLTFMMYLGGKFVLTNPFGGSTVITVGGVNVTGGTIPTNGIYEPLANFLGFTTNGIERFYVSSTGSIVLIANFTTQTLVVNGSAGIPSATFFESLNAINALKNVATYDTGTFTATLTGCTTSPTVSVHWSRNGNAITLDIPTLTATSNTTACTLTGLPASLSPVRDQVMAIANLEDNTITALAGYASIAAGATTIVLALGAVTGAALHMSPTNFTNAGTKGIVTTTVTYNLT